MTIQRLSQYRAIKKEIEAIESRLKISLSAVSLNGMPSSGAVAKPTEETALLLEELKRTYQNRLSELLRAEKEIITFISSMEDIELAVHVREKYIEGVQTENTTACAVDRYDRTTMYKRLRAYIQKENSLR